MQATAIAQPNIALVKYWGKRDLKKNLPAVGSISVTLSDLETEMSVSLHAQQRHDSLSINGDNSDAMLPRVSKALDAIIGKKRPRATVASRSNFPIAAGLASSASAFAALAVAAANASGQSLSVEALSRHAGHASGSAARSLFGGFVELKNSADSINVSQLCAAEEWPLRVVVAITELGPKAVGSSEAMEISRKTSPFYDDWVARQEDDLDVARCAIESRDFDSLAAVSEHSCLKMHSVMWASRPPLVYWNASTMRCMQTVRALQDKGIKVFFTIDAGPQLKAVCESDHVDIVQEALHATDGVIDVICTSLGGGARQVASS